jgi:hypothetical protein
MEWKTLPTRSERAGPEATEDEEKEISFGFGGNELGDGAAGAGSVDALGIESEKGVEWTRRKRRPG